MIQPITEFIIEIPKSHQDEIVLKNGLVLKFDVKFDQGAHVNRIGVVVATPIKFDTKIKIGDIVLVDKNMITFQVHSDDLVNKSQFLVDEKKGHYRIPANMIYLYKSNPDSEWICPAPFVFIKPIPYEEAKTESGILFTEKGYKGNKEQYGTTVYLNEVARKQLKEGDTVYYKKDREYEFTIDGELLYHMENEDILAQVE
jgi:co-chaperonin GroES (HSP10)